MNNPNEIVCCEECDAVLCDGACPNCDCPLDEPWDGFRTDAEADADVLASAGHGTNEDYGYYGENDDADDSYGDDA